MPYYRLTVLIAVVLMLAACAGPNPILAEPMLVSEVSGFWGGLWHGLVLPLSLLVSLLTDYVSIYAVENTGGGYDIGFFLGASITAGIFWNIDW